jgi:signal transduction histidine kinase
MLSIQNGLLKRLLLRYGITVSVVAVAFLVRLVLTEYVGPGLPTYVTFYPAVMLAAIIFGFWAGLLATAMVAAISAYWILAPVGFAIALLSDFVGLCFFSGMGVFISVVAEFYRRTRQRAQELSLELTKANETLRHLSSKLLSAHEDERKRIAGEIHDTLGACLTGIKFKAENAQLQTGKTANTPTESLNTIIPLVQECIEECKRIQMDLRPSILDDLGLLAAFSWFWRRIQTIYSNTRIEREIEIEEGDIPPRLKIVAFRVTQEAMNNITKHSKADLVRFRLRKLDGRMELVLQDNGQGFDLEKVLSSESTGRGLGITSMRERTELSGGSFVIESTEGKGTIIHASWPLHGNG